LPRERFSFNTVDVPNLEDFNAGALYRHNFTEQIVEFVGIAVAAKIDSSDAPLIGLAFGAGMEGENVGVFRAVVVAGRGGEIIEFLSVDDTAVTAGEAVGVFGVIESPGSFVLATRLGFEGGDTFTPLDDEIADDLG
jgi:hypothetical protein